AGRRLRIDAAARTGLAMDLGLKGRVALVAGGSEGIGKAIASELAREGARVAICARRLDVLESAATQIGEQAGGAEVLPLQADVSSEQAVAAVAQELFARWEPPAILVNAAGHGKRGTLATVGAAQMQEMLDLNLLPCLLLART